MEKSNTLLYAERELNILAKTVKDPIIAPFYSEILALCEKFGRSGQSGGSAPFVANAIAEAIKKLCLQKPICEITGVDDEWIDVADYTDLAGEKGFVFQNIRCGSIFKRGKEGRPYYLDAIVWKTPDGITYNGTARLGCEIFTSRQHIKKFPFTPKTFYVDVEMVEKEIAPTDWEFLIKNHKQLTAAFKYYDKFLDK